MSPKPRFATLDALRGIAAIGVMAYHMQPHGPLPAAAGYLAVDLFFCLSGFVVAHAYGEALRDGLGFGAFLLRRWLRFYPMLFVGGVLAIVLAGADLRILMLLPEPGARYLFPANRSFWTLLFELGANLLYAAFGFRLGPRARAAVMAASAAVLVVAPLKGEFLFESGPLWTTAHLGVARTLFAFTAGLEIHARLPGENRRTSWAALLPLAFAAMWLIATPVWPAAYDLAGEFLLAPALVALGARWELPNKTLAAVLGGLSYPLYCIHMPVVAAAGASFARVTLAGAACLVMAVALERWVDRPLQRRFRAWLAPGAAAPQTRIGIST